MCTSCHAGGMRNAVIRFNAEADVRGRPLAPRYDGRFNPASRSHQFSCVTTFMAGCSFRDRASPDSDADNAWAGTSGRPVIARCFSASAYMISLFTDSANPIEIVRSCCRSEPRLGIFELKDDT